jgi:gluconolactonase
MPVDVETFAEGLDHPEGVTVGPGGHVCASGEDLTLDGDIVLIAEDPEGTTLAAPTNVVFAGPSLDVLVCANYNRWHLAMLRPGLRGAGLLYPSGQHASGSCREG